VEANEVFGEGRTGPTRKMASDLMFSGSLLKTNLPFQITNVSFYVGVVWHAPRLRSAYMAASCWLGPSSYGTAAENEALPEGSGPKITWNSEPH
jgi:hypothetical protein